MGTAMSNFNKNDAFVRYGRYFTDAAEYFRNIALEIAEQPELILQHLEHPIMKYLAQDRHSTCLERTKILEALAYGDAGVMLAAPGPSLSGLIIRELGTTEQQELFYSYVSKNKARTFFAVTEPDKGSDASNLQTKLIRKDNSSENFSLTGEKWLVGNGASGTIGTVMARIAPGPLGIVVVLLTPELLQQENQLIRSKLPMACLQGAQLAYLAFDSLAVPPTNVLGMQLPATKRGLTAIIATFNKMRPCVGALALGLAQAVLDYISLERTKLLSNEKFKLAGLKTQLEVARQLIHKAAVLADTNPSDTAAISLAKLNATHLAETITTIAFDYFGKGAFFEHPWLAKWYRDSFCFEFMEGTTQIQNNHIFASALKNEFLIK